MASRVIVLFLLVLFLVVVTAIIYQALDPPPYPVTSSCVDQPIGSVLTYLIGELDAANPKPIDINDRMAALKNPYIWQPCGESLRGESASFIGRSGSDTWIIKCSFSFPEKKAIWTMERGTSCPQYEGIPK